MIAISYRRDDVTPVAGRLHDRLRAEFGRENVFMDFDSIPYGVDFRDHIKRTLERAQVVVAVVGPRWLGDHKDLRRIDDPSDFVRLEIAGALQRGIPVIPVLVDDTPMPTSDKLPEEIASFAFRNALVLDTGIDFHHHADRLVSGIRQLIGAAGQEQAPVKSLTVMSETKSADAPVITPAPQPGQEPEAVKALPTGTTPISIPVEAPAAEALPAGATPHPKRPPRSRKSPVAATVPAQRSRPPKRPASSPVETPPSALPSGPRKFSVDLKLVAFAGGALALVVIALVIGRAVSRKPAVASESVSSSTATPFAATSATAAALPTAAIVPVDNASSTAMTRSTATPAEVASSSTPTVVATAANAVSVAAATPGATAAQSFPAYSATTADDETVRQFVREYYDAMSRHDLDTIVSKFSDWVDYQGQGHHDRPYIRNDTNNYFRRWSRVYFEVGDIQVTHLATGDIQVVFSFPFAVGQGVGSDKRGISSQVWILHRDSFGTLQIVAQHERVLNGVVKPRTRRR